MNEITNNGHSNYDGLSFAVKQRVTKGLYGGATFTWSHALDNISNGGFFQFNLTEGSTTGNSFRYQLNPYDPNKPGYGSSDYDFRHNFSAYYVWTMPRMSEGMMDKVLGGWTVAQVFLVRGGEPFSVIDTANSKRVHERVELNALGGVFGRTENLFSERSCDAVPEQPPTSQLR